MQGMLWVRLSGCEAADRQERFQAGDDQALCQAFDRYAGMVQRVGMLRLGNHHDAEELVQQVFVRAWKGRAGFDPTRGSLG